MKIGALKVESQGAERRQPVRLPLGLYGGLFARYSAPKQYAKFQSTETEEKFFVSFVITHDAAARQLPHFSEAFAGVRTKAFYDPATGMKSTFVAFWEALMNGKMTADEIVDAAEANELPDLDEKIGQPVRLFIVPAQKPDKNAIFTNKIDTQRGGFEKPDAAFTKAVIPIYNTIDTGYSEQSGLRYLTKPKPEFEDEIGESERVVVDEAIEDEVPF